jgi:hypothetical protein
MLLSQITIQTTWVFFSSCLHSWLLFTVISSGRLKWLQQMWYCFRKLHFEHRRYFPPLLKLIYELNLIYSLTCHYCTKNVTLLRQCMIRTTNCVALILRLLIKLCHFWKKIMIDDLSNNRTACISSLDDWGYLDQIKDLSIAQRHWTNEM